MKRQLKIIVSDIRDSGDHEGKVNQFLSQDIEIVNVQNEINSGRDFSKYTNSEIVTIITYKTEA